MRRPIFYLILIGWHLTAVKVVFSQSKGAGKLEVASTERRMALVVGMANYVYFNPLSNPDHDAEDMTITLKKLGFAVTPCINKGLRDMDAIIQSFVDNLLPNDVVFFYFSGHGVGYQNENYLMPIDTRFGCLEEIPKFTFSVSHLQALFRNQKVRNSFMVLDACRSLDGRIKLCRTTTKDNQFAPQGFVISSGQTGGDMIVYATEVGQVADDNIASRNGLFTQELLKQLVIPDLTFGQILFNTASNVFAESSKDPNKIVQLPTSYGELGRGFMFLKTIRSADTNVETIHKPTELEAELARLRKENETLRTRNVEPVITTPKLEEKTINKFLDLPFVELVYVPGGSFEMGSNNGDGHERPVHRVTLSSFYMGKYEVTVGQFGAFVDATGYNTEAENGNGNGSYVHSNDKWRKKAGINWRHDEEGKFRGISEQNYPVIHVSHNDATAFCGWLVKREGLAYRSPTEAEWEYAAGGGGNRDRTAWFGTSEKNKLPEYANLDCSDDGYKYSSPVGKKRPNQLGLYDMSGNVLEWFFD